MRGIWLLLIYAVLLLFVIGTGADAFSAPWTWTPVQIRFSFLMVSVAIGLGYWGVVWLRGGSAAVKAQWAARRERMRQPFEWKVFGKILLFWIGIAVALVVLFNLHRL